MYLSSLGSWAYPSEFFPNKKFKYDLFMGSNTCFATVLLSQKVIVSYIQRQNETKAGKAASFDICIQHLFLQRYNPFFLLLRFFAQIGRNLETLNSMNFANVLKMAKQYRQPKREDCIMSILKVAKVCSPLLHAMCKGSISGVFQKWVSFLFGLWTNEIA